MSFRLDLANRAGLFRNYASWYEDKNNLIDSAHLSMGFKIGYLISSIEKIHSLESECISQFKLFKPNLKIKNSEFLFKSPTLFDLFSEISISLDLMRQIQDLLIGKLIGKFYQTSLPGSMNSFIKNIRKENSKYKNKVEVTVIDTIVKYWEKSGFLVKQFRDIGQHHDILFEHAYILSSGDEYSLHLRLPDNPEVKSTKRYTYSKKTDCVKFINFAFSDIHNLINDISINIGYKEERVFDYNTNLISSNESLSLLFDPFKNLMVAHETYEENGSVIGNTLLHKVDLDNYSFIKKPSFFEATVSLEKEYQIKDNASFQIQKNSKSGKSRFLSHSPHTTPHAAPQGAVHQLCSFNRT